MNYSEYYLRESVFKKVISTEDAGNVAWICPSNIALIKYWGKGEGQIPMNPSLSFTLADSVTKTNISYHYDRALKKSRLEYFFEDKIDESFQNRIEYYLKNIEGYLPFLKKIQLNIHSENTFPHSAGIASSASSFGALALCLISIEDELTGSKMIYEELLSKASFLARLGSGSAARSVFGGTVEWGRIEKFEHSSDEIAIPLGNRIHSIFNNFQDVVLLIDESNKRVSSSEGHRLMNENPYAEQRYKQARKNLERLISALEIGDLDSFIQIVENEALSLHSLMLTSGNGYFLIKQGTIDVIEKVRFFRNSKKIPLTFTLDAGANVHLLFPNLNSKEVMDFIQTELIRYCVNGNFIHDKVGLGPYKILANEKAER
jgi:diphosphomevalonate decarboxylase